MKEMTLTLKEMYLSYELYANNIHNWVNLSKTELANGYIAAEQSKDNQLMNSYFGALMCKYWYMIPYEYMRNKGLRLAIEDFVYIIADGILTGLKYRRWQDPDWDVSKQEDGAAIVFNRCIYSAVLREYSVTNRNNHRINYETFSLDGLKEEIKRKNNTQAGEDKDNKFDIEDETDAYKEQQSKNTVDYIVEYFIKNQEYLSAIIVDSIAYGDCYKYFTEKETIDFLDEQLQIKTSSFQFNPKKIVSSLNKLNQDNMDYYLHNYSFNQDLLKSCITSIGKLNNDKLYTKIDETLNTIKENQYLLSLLYTK